MSVKSSSDKTVVFEANVRQWLKSEGAGATAVHVSEPREVGCFSRRADRTVVYGNREKLRKFQEPKLLSDLGAGFDNFRAKDESEVGVGVETVFQALQHAGFDVQHSADLVTYRNNLNKIAQTPYNTRDPWEFDATLVQNTVYLNIRQLDEPTPNLRHQRFMYMGYKFEALCTGRASEPVDANEEFCACIRLRVGNHRILLAAEMDAELTSEEAPSNKSSYIELKTMKKPSSTRDFVTLYSSRYLKWFVQSYLAGVRTLFIGLRDERGILVAVDHVSTRSLPRAAREGLRRHASDGVPGMAWEPAACINFLDYIVDHVRRKCVEHSRSTLRFSYNPEKSLIVGRVLPVNTTYESLAQVVTPACQNQSP
jgi:RAT1-interacting protein